MVVAAAAEAEAGGVGALRSLGSKFALVKTERRREKRAWKIRLIHRCVHCKADHHNSDAKKLRGEIIRTFPQTDIGLPCPPMYVLVDIYVRNLHKHHAK